MGSTVQNLPAAFGLAPAVVPLNSLVGVFLGSTIDSSTTPLGLDFFHGDLVATPTLYPQLQQVFYIGNGVTTGLQPRVFVPLPTALGNTQVFFDTYAAPLFYVSPTQIVAQVPYEVYGSTKAMVTVVVNGVASLGQTVGLQPVSAGIFTTGAGEPVIIDNNTGARVSASAPATRGDTLIIWATGLGPTAFDPPTGNPAPAIASSTLVPISVNLKSAATGTQITVPAQYAGLAPNFVGLDQVNLQLPANALTGSVILQMVNGSNILGNQVVIGIQ